MISKNNESTFWVNPKRLIKAIIFVLLFIILFPLIVNYDLFKDDVDDINRNIGRSISQLDTYEDYNNVKPVDIKFRIEEMLRIKHTVSIELRELEEHRQKLLTEVEEYNNRVDNLKQELSHQRNELDRLKMSIEQAKLAQHEVIQNNSPEISLPKILQSNDIPKYNKPIEKKSSNMCEMSNCFDHSRCSLTSGFPVYLYDFESHKILNNGYDIDGFLKTTIKQAFGYNAHMVNDPKIACVYLILIGEALPDKESSYDDIIDLKKLYKLPYWGGDGRNHIILNLSRRNLKCTEKSILKYQNTMRAIIVQSSFYKFQYRHKFDVIVPPILGPPGGDVWQECSNILPARRKYLLSYQGELKYFNKISINNVSNTTNTLDDFIIDHLNGLLNISKKDKFLLHFKCIPATDSNLQYMLKDWILCGTDSSRKNILKESTFSLILPPHDGLISSNLMLARLYESLRSGAIPVILGADEIYMPYSETIEWKRITIMLPKARITELHFLLRTISDSDILLMRQQGRNIWERYLSSVQANIDTIIATVRERLGIPPRPMPSIILEDILNSSFIPLKSDKKAEESLGPYEEPYSSPKYKRNYTIFRLQGRELWNNYNDPFYLYPQLPYDPVLPSEAKFLGSHFGFRPLGNGAGGTGKEFSEALGGNYPKEQFTIIMLTYEREQVLIDSIEQFYGLPYLNKIIIIWNSPKPPIDDLRLPDIGVPVKIVRATRNSLNNRFLPLNIIETEAILSIDDDVRLRHDEIIFGFRVWRENRNSIVGFPGRYHAWDLNYKNGWNYNSNYSCELSMVLTGASFFHVYYSYLYTYWLPQAIRDKVDEYMNCEDIAMNFLVSHWTRKPPVKVTSRWTFRCPGCSNTLSSDDTHFYERHKCINFFTKVFGYTPLLYTQYRADSVLFKTRISRGKQKCFKYV